jgi:hypothetical protein
MGDGRERGRSELGDLPVPEDDLAPGVEGVIAGIAVFAAAFEAEVVGWVGGQVDEARGQEQKEQAEKVKILKAG